MPPIVVVTPEQDFLAFEFAYVFEVGFYVLKRHRPAYIAGDEHNVVVGYVFLPERGNFIDKCKSLIAKTFMPIL